MKIKKYIIIIILLISYLIFGKLTGLYLFCPIHKFLGLYCPGCGLTRMIYSILRLDFKSAFRYNQFLFIIFPFALFLFIESIYSDIKGRKPLYQRMPQWIWIVLIVFLLAYGVLRNIFPVLAPIE